MTSFVNESGEYLDFLDDVGLSKQCANFFEFKIKGDVSVTLKLPNNSVNRKALGYNGPAAGNPGRVVFSMVMDGNVISKGYIIIKDSDKEVINAFYISGNSNWFQDFQFNLKEIDFDSKYTVLSNDFDGQKANTEGLIFPLVDWFADGAKRSASYYASYPSPTPEEYPDFTEHHACLYVHTLVEQIGAYAGYTFRGDLVDDEFYKKLILTPAGPEYSVPDVVIKRTYCKLQNGPFGSAGAGLYDYTLDPQLVRFNTVVEGSGQTDVSTYSFFAPVTGTYRIDSDFWFSVADTYAVELYVNGALDRVLFNQSVTTQNKAGVTFINLIRGDQLQFYVNNTAGANYRLDYLSQSKYTNVSIQLNKIASTPIPNLVSTGTVNSAYYVLPNMIAPDMKAIDFIKFLVNYFSCSVSFDEYSKVIYLNKLSGFKKEDAEDWSQYLVNFTTRWDTKVATNNYIQFEEGPEKDIVAYNESKNLKYGGGTIETGFDAEEEKDLFSVPFSPSWDVKNKSYRNVFMPFISFYELEYGESVSYSGVTSSGGLAKFTCTFQDAFLASDIFYIISTSGIYSGYATFTTGSDTTTTNPTLNITYSAGDSGTIIRCRPNRVDGPNRLLVCQAARPLADIGLTSLTVKHTATNISTPTSVPVAWFDKPNVLLPVDEFNESCAIDSTNTRSLTISQRYYGPIKKILNNPMAEATMLLPVGVFQGFNFDKYVRLETDEISGYFVVQSIENYKDSLTPVKVTLLYAD